mmetsp:Transcript_22783/g.48097  ORF Transcript_22783/g.48097 Transcript_22783/m.48097 type:complete len:95 (-) Transcript_22783:1724-2008(-)
MVESHYNSNKFIKIVHGVKTHVVKERDDLKCCEILDVYDAGILYFSKKKNCFYDASKLEVGDRNSNANWLHFSWEVALLVLAPESYLAQLANNE